MSFKERLAQADGLEQRIVEELRSRGWHAELFGQALFSEEVRRLLRFYEDGARRPTLIRWLPDIITGRMAGKTRSYVALIDAKACGERLNYAIEMAALETLELYTDRFYIPAFFVFDDLRVLTPREARLRGRPGPEPSPGAGSGTPYLLIQRRWSREFDTIFPAVP